MATPGELVWASFIASRPLLANTSRLGDTAHIRIFFDHNKTDYLETPETDPLSLWSTSFSFIWSKRVPVSVCIIYSSFVPGKVTVTTTVGLLWNPIVTSVSSGWKYRFDAKSLKKASLVRTVSPQGIARSLKAPHLSVPIRPLQSIIAKARRLSSKISRPILSSTKKPGFGGKTQTRVDQLGTYIDAFESNSSAYHEQLKTYVKYHRSGSGSNTPNFRSTPKRLLPNNAYSGNIVETNDAQAYYGRFTNNTSFANTWDKTSRLFYVEWPSAAHSSAAVNNALRAIIAQANAGISANIAQDLAQFGQTRRLVAQNATRIAQSISALRRGDIRRASSALSGQPLKRGRGNESRRKVPTSKQLAENWLELQYGWKPLLNDIHDSLEATRRYLAKGPPVKTVRARSSIRTIARPSVRPVIVGDSSPSVGLREISSHTTATYGLTYKMDNDLLNFYSQIGFTSPVSLAWEVLPYSFVVDWFLPLGPYFDAMSAFKGLTFVRGYLTRFTRQVQTAQIYYTGFYPGFAGNETHTMRGSYSKKEIVWDRQVLNGFPYPTLSLKDPISTTHVLNSLALLRASFK